MSTESEIRKKSKCMQTSGEEQWDWKLLTPSNDTK